MKPTENRAFQPRRYSSVFITGVPKELTYLKRDCEPLGAVALVAAFDPLRTLGPWATIPPSEREAGLAKNLIIALLTGMLVWFGTAIVRLEQYLSGRSQEG